MCSLFNENYLRALFGNFDGRVKVPSGWHDESGRNIQRSFRRVCSLLNAFYPSGIYSRAN
jgi:hypothetical protein